MIDEFLGDTKWRGILFVGVPFNLRANHRQGTASSSSHASYSNTNCHSFGVRITGKKSYLMGGNKYFSDIKQWVKEHGGGQACLLNTTVAHRSLTATHLSLQPIRGQACLLKVTALHSVIFWKCIELSKFSSRSGVGQQPAAGAAGVVRGG